MEVEGGSAMKRLLDVNLRRDEFLKLGAPAIGLALGDPGALYGTIQASESPAAGTRTGGGSSQIKVYSTQRKGYVMTEKVIRTDAEWKKLLSPEQFHGTRKKVTERAFSGQYWDTKETGIYQCICCETALSVPFFRVTWNCSGLSSFF